MVALGAVFDTAQQAHGRVGSNRIVELHRVQIFHRDPSENRPKWWRACRRKGERKARQSEMPTTPSASPLKVRRNVRHVKSCLANHLAMPTA